MFAFFVQTKKVINLCMFFFCLPFTTKPFWTQIITNTFHKQTYKENSLYLSDFFSFSLLSPCGSVETWEEMCVDVGTYGVSHHCWAEPPHQEYILCQEVWRSQELSHPHSILLFSLNYAIPSECHFHLSHCTACLDSVFSVSNINPWMHWESRFVFL